MPISSLWESQVYLLYRFTLQVYFPSQLTLKVSWVSCHFEGKRKRFLLQFIMVSWLQSRPSPLHHTPSCQSKFPKAQVWPYPLLRKFPLFPIECRINKTKQNNSGIEGLKDVCATYIESTFLFSFHIPSFHPFLWSNKICSPYQACHLPFLPIFQESSLSFSSPFRSHWVFQRSFQGLHPPRKVPLFF